ncbi:MAG: phosphodiesterase, partial [Actinobacteria bacterium]|nr:phosphodiesterase [Actinomycetota bacterium]
MAPQASRNLSTLIVQLTDTHIVANARLCHNEIDTSSFLRAAVETVRQLTVRPDAVLITGDLVNEGRVNQYDHLKVLLAPIVTAGMPLYLMPGNHDNRAAMREVFPDHGELGKGPSCDFVADIGALRLVGLDTLVDHEAGGDLSANQLEW